MARRTTTTRGIGTGTAQIFDTSQSQRAFERGQGIQAKKRQQDAAARKKAVDDAIAEVQSLLDEDVWETRDRATYQQAYNDLMSQYEGRWQEVYSDPQVYSELISGVGKVKNLGRRSVEHKELVQPFVKSTYSNPKMQEYITEEGREAVKNLQTPRALTDLEYFKENWEIANTFNTEEINPLERFGELFNRNLVEVVADGTRVVNGQQISSGSTYVPRTPKGDNPGFDNTALSIVKNMNAAEKQSIAEKYGDGELTDEAIKAFIDDAYGTYAAGRTDDYSVTPFDGGGLGSIDWDAWSDSPSQPDYEYAENSLQTISSPRGRAKVQIGEVSYIGDRKPLPGAGFKATITPSTNTLDFMTGEPLKATSGEVEFVDRFIPNEDVNGLKAGRVYLVGNVSSRLTGKGEPTVVAVPLSEAREQVVSAYKSEDAYRALNNRGGELD